MASTVEPAVQVLHGALRFGTRTLFDQLDLTVMPGEFLAVLGPNGAGKSSLLRVLLGRIQLTAGTVRIGGAEPREARSQIGSIPQQRAFDVDLPIRGRDLVQFGLDGGRLGLCRSSRRTRPLIDGALRAVGATSFADAPLGTLSGGEQQRLRVAQALLTNPDLLLCDEPLLSLDPANQQTVCRLLDERRHQAGTAVVFVTHDINPVLPFVDRVLYIAAGQWALGTPHEILTTAQLSQLYGSPVAVVRIGDRILIVGDTAAHEHEPPSTRSTVR